MNRFLDELASHRSTLDEMAGLTDKVDAAAEILVEACLSGRIVLACGNGGSSSDAQHLVGELVGRFVSERRALSAVALSGQEGAFTAIANDYGYEMAFARQVFGLGQDGGVLCAFSTSGNSPNVVKAVEAAKSKGMKVISFTAADGGQLLKLSDVCLNAPSVLTRRAQEMHIILIHTLCGAVDDVLA